MKILYVEDNPFDADITRRELSRQAPQLQLDVADTLAAAYQRLETPDGYAAVLLDLRLPDGDGLSLLNYIRAHELPLVVVILTGGGDEETAVSALKAGADDYIIKQKDYLKELPRTLNNAIRRFETGQKVRSRRLRVLYAETNPQDIEQTRHHLERHATYIQLDVSATESEIMAVLQDPAALKAYDVLLLDYGLSGLNALEVVKQLSQDSEPRLPVVLVTGLGNEEVALQALKLGASDYVVKRPGYLYRLPSVLENAFFLAELEREQRALRESEWRFRLLAENAQDGIFRYLMTRDSFDYVSPAMTEIFGYTAEEFYAQPEIWHKLIAPGDEPDFLQRFAGLEEAKKGLVVRCVHQDGHAVWTEQRFSFLKSPEGKVLEVHGFVRDISARHQMDEERERMAVEKEAAARLLAESYERMIEGWALALELRDRETEGHSLRVAYLTVELAQALGVTGEALNVIRRGALLHDIGKLGVPDGILKKPGPLNEEEWEIMHQHPAYAYKLIYPIPYLRDAVEIPYGHHERWDGSGYPLGLKGAEIPFAARIFAVVDVWDALNSDQPYRPAWDREHIVRFLREQAGVKFDAQVVETLLDRVLKNIA